MSDSTRNGTVAMAQVIALGGGGFGEAGTPTRLDSYILEQARGESPRICFVGTASGDDDGYIDSFYTAYRQLSCEPSHLSLSQPPADVLSLVMAQDAFYVGGGNTVTMLATWRHHGLDAALRHAAGAGAVMAGISAGAMCWFQAGVTDSGPSEFRPLHDGLGLLDGSFCPHYSVGGLRATYRGLIEGGFPGGYGVDDGAGLHFVNGVLKGAVAETDSARAYRVERTNGELAELPLPMSFS